MVVGAGIIGAAVALRLQKDGYAVSIVDRQAPMNGCSAGNAGHLSESSIFPPVSPSLLIQLPRLLMARDGPVVVGAAYAPKLASWAMHALPLMRATARTRVTDAMTSLTVPSFEHLYRLARIADATNLLDRDGVVLAFRHAAALEKIAAAIPQWLEHGIAVERLATTDLAESEPALSKGLAGGLLFKNSGRCVDPQALGLRLLQSALRYGASFQQAGVQEIRRDASGLSVRTSTGSINADHVVVCAGLASAELLRALGCKVPLASERGYHLMLPAATGLLRRPVAFPEHYFIATPMNAGLRLAGTAEFKAPDAAPDYRRAEALRAHAKPFFERLPDRDAVPWMGVRPSTPDGLPVIGEIEGVPGVLAAFGHGHCGLTWSGITASCVSALLGGDAVDCDLRAFAPKRFGSVFNHRSR